MSPRQAFDQRALFEPVVAESHAEIPDVTSLETDFPIELVSLLAEKESWRKEIHRPATHAHKWWAQRLGSVFRAILVSAVTSTREEAERAIRDTVRLPGVVVFDPFAGSGTTLVEAAKLGARVIGRDINPVATLVQRQALSAWDFASIEAAFKQVEEACRDDILALYRSSSGDTVLYYFWVAIAVCPDCAEAVELFSDYVFARNAYPRRVPEARAICPRCHGVTLVDTSVDSSFYCERCRTKIPFVGPVEGQWMTCERGHRNRVVDALDGVPPEYRMYAKLVVNSRGEKRYEPIDDFDVGLFSEASKLLRERRASLPQPRGQLEPGHNTRQAIRWGFTSWADFFNDRQLYALGLIAAAIDQLPVDSREREALTCLLSGTLEFNSLFCSYKGEGTGAVRHTFSHHVLKPERTPLEANPWGTPQSSGAFATLFERRLQRAHEYKMSPHDLVLIDGRIARVFGISAPIGTEVVSTYADFVNSPDRSYVVTGDSSATDLPDACVDLVITDPPFMDNVHYSELADFFHSWLQVVKPFSSYSDLPTTRQDAEVQSAEPEAFGQAIQSVWRECERVLKDDGILAFTFHQARIAGWVQLMLALREAGFVVTALQPVKAEMSVSTTKAAAQQPSNLDSIVVCRKRSTTSGVLERRPTVQEAVERLRRLQAAGIKVSRTDIRSVVSGSVLSSITDPGLEFDIDATLRSAEMAANQACEELASGTS